VAFLKNLKPWAVIELKLILNKGGLITAYSSTKKELKRNRKKLEIIMLIPNAKTFSSRK
jgi:hypothetical protein